MKYRLLIPKHWIYPKDYGGMNFHAAREGKHPWRWSRSTIVVQGGQGKAKTRNTFLHEAVEDMRMRRFGEPYKVAHRRSMAFESGARRHRGKRK